MAITLQLNEEHVYLYTDDAKYAIVATIVQWHKAGSQKKHEMIEEALKELAEREEAAKAAALKPKRWGRAK